jgi:lysyl-tRNA synthetase class 2
MHENWALSRKRPALLFRGATMQRIRHFFSAEGFLEMETPLRIPAPAPELHIDAIPSDGWYLQTSPELCLKRLLAAGYDNIFQISHCWRKGERGRLHLPEFTMLEWYRANMDYLQLMNDCERLIRSLIDGDGCKIEYQGKTVNLHGEWERLTVGEAFSRYSSLSMEESLKSGRFDEQMVTEIEPHLGQGRPTFIYEYPAASAALARIKANDRSVAERFELYIAGVELANAFSELTDPAEQRSRFIAESSARKESGLPTYPLPEPFLKELYGVKSAAGIALGVDRLIMLLLDLTTIDEVVAFTPEDL